MGFYLYTGNRLEILARQRLCKILSQRPLKDPFKQEKIIVQSQGMSSWLKLQIADNIPICANIEFPFLYSFIKEVLEKTLPQDLRPNIDLFTHDVLIWKIFDILPEIAGNHPELSSYLKGRNSKIKQYQLSEKISYSFDQYEIFRPDILLNWKDNIIKKKVNEWQAQIWQNISRNNISRSQGFQNFFSLGDISKLDYERIFVFGITTMPAVYINFFQTLGHSDNIDVHFFYLTPCKKNWEYNLSKKEAERINSFLSIKNISNPEDFMEQGNPLLSSFGQVGREFFSSILDVTEYDTEDCFTETKVSSTLELIQDNILNNKPTAELQYSQDKYDRSIQFHNCHNKTREIEVLYDNLINIIELDNTIQPGDIIVTTPNITAYEPYIKSVFNRRNEESLDSLQLPYSLSDIKMAKNSKVVNSFIKLLELVSSKYKMTEILDLLETTAIREAFDIEDENIDLLRKWTDESGMRWGINAEHRSSLGLPVFNENSISAGLNSLLLGIALEDTEDVYNNIFPYDEIEIAESELLGKFSHFLSSLSEIRTILTKKYTMNQWHDILNSVIDKFFINNNNTFKDISILVNVIVSLKESAELAGFEKEVTLDIVRSYITEHIETETIYEGFLRGKITFCTMLPMRGIPAKVICMLGMNDGEFPRQETKIGFNIIDKEIRLCDRSKKMEDKYIFLESILAARKNLYISYIGQSDKSNEIYSPAGPVCELIDYLKQICGEECVESMVTNHKLQAFNSIYFNCTNSNFFSYSAVDCNAAKTLNSEKKHKTQKAEETRNREKEKDLSTINIEGLTAFFKNPCRAFLNQTLNVAYSSINLTETLDTEPFTINNLEKYTLTQELLSSVIKEKDRNKLYKKLKYSGKLQVGIEGESYFNNLYTQINTILTTSFKGIEPAKELLNNTNSTNFEFELDNHICINGNLDNFSEAGYQVCLILAKESGKRVLECWLNHLCLAASGKGERTYYFICKPGEKTNSTGILENVSQQEAMQMLLILTDIYKEGVKKPIPFFPESSYVFAKRNKQKILYAKNTFNGNNYFSYNSESDDPYIRACFDDNIIETTDFSHYAKTIFNNYWVEED